MEIYSFGSGLIPSKTDARGAAASEQKHKIASDDALMAKWVSAIATAGQTRMSVDEFRT